jgi:hypothetical protein
MVIQAQFHPPSSTTRFILLLIPEEGIEELELLGCGKPALLIQAKS